MIIIVYIDYNDCKQTCFFQSIRLLLDQYPIDQHSSVLNMPERCPSIATIPVKLGEEFIIRGNHHSYIQLILL